MSISLVRLEWRYLTRQPVFFIAMFLYAFFAFFVTGRLGYTGKVFVNAPHSITSTYLFLSLLSPIVLSLLAVNLFLRDDIHKMHEMVHASGISPKTLLINRFLALIGTTTLILAIAGGFMMLRVQIPIGIEGTFTSDNPLHYLRTLTTLILPTLLFCGALITLVAVLSRNAIAVYITGMAIYMLYFLAAMFVDTPMMSGSLPAGSSIAVAAALIDPFAMATFSQVTQTWTAAQRNAQHVGLSGLVLWNLIFRLGMAAVIFVLLYMSCRFGVKSTKPKKQTEPDRTGEHPYLPVTPLPNHPLAFGYSVRLECAQILKSFPFWVMLLLWTIFLVGEIFPIVKVYEFGAPIYPMTSRILERFLHDLLPRFCLFVIVFYSGEMVWRERGLDTAAFLDTTPAKSAVFFAAKFAALCLIPFFLITLAVMVGLTLQLMTGYHWFEPGLYLSVYYYGGLPLVLGIVLCLFVQTMVPNKHIGMLISGLLLLFLGTNLSAAIGLEHGMWHYAAIPDFRYSDMNGYAHISDAGFGYMIYWSALAVLLGLLSFGLWRRGSDQHMRTRLSQVRSQLGRPGFITAAGAVAVFLTSGAYIFHQTNIATGYYSSSDQVQWSVEYERRFKTYQTLPQPKITHVNTAVDLYPNSRRFKAVGQYTLTNHLQEPISQILISLDPDMDLQELQLEGAVPMDAAPHLGQYPFLCNPPMEPGEQIKLSFTVSQQQSGFGQFQNNTLVTKNGSILFSPALFPLVGYQPNYQQDNPHLRQEHDLPPLPPMEHINQSCERTGGDFTGSDDFISFETVISTAVDQTAVAPGSLQAAWKEGNRAYFHYKSDAPIRNIPTYLSAQYEVVVDHVGDIEILLYHHPRHNTNIERIMSAIKDSLAYHTLNFGPYQHRQFKHVEIPQFTGMSAFATPTMTLMAEHAGWTHDLRDQRNLDQVYRRTAHEVAHQWWAHQVAPAKIDEGATVLIETLAKYSELAAIQHFHGKAQAERLVTYETGRYLRGRARERDAEHPLYRVRDDQQYLMYSKGSAAMYALKNAMGEDRVNQALQELVTQHAHPRNPGTSLDLINLLHQAAPEQGELIDQWFKEIITWNVKQYTAGVTPAGNGHYQLELQLELEKFNWDGSGQNTAEDYQRHLDLAITLNTDQATTTQMHSVSIQAGVNSIRMVLDGPPTGISLDPNRALLITNREAANLELEIQD